MAMELAGIPRASRLPTRPNSATNGSWVDAPTPILARREPDWAERWWVTDRGEKDERVAGKKKKIRVELRKNRGNKPGRRPKVSSDLADHVDTPRDERISGKGELSRYRTIIQTDDGEAGETPLLDVDVATCVTGRVTSPRGNACLVQLDDGTLYDCTVRRLVKNLASDDRVSVVAGDRVLVKPTGNGQGLIARVEPRRSTLSRQQYRQRHVLVANIDLILIMASAADPPLKPSLIDRYLISATLGRIEPVICINKADLSSAVELQAVVGLYSQLGYEILLTSAVDGRGIGYLRSRLKGKAAAVSGQSGVGKSSLINVLQPGLNLRTGGVSSETRKGRHTTTNAQLHHLDSGGWIVDTPGIRQLELWDVIPDQVEGFFVEFHPFVRHCQFPDCTHTHERGCGVKRAVALKFISDLRYESYCRIRDRQD